MIIDFLTLELTDEQLKHALEVIKGFKQCESHDEWMAIPFASWVKLEQLVEYLEHRVNGKPLDPDTLAYIEKHKP